MGHISPHAIRELVKNELVTRLTLDPKSEASFAALVQKLNLPASPFQRSKPAHLHLILVIRSIQTCGAQLCPTAMMEKTILLVLLMTTAGGAELNP